MHQPSSLEALQEPLEYQQQYWAVTNQESKGVQQLGDEGLIYEEPKIREKCFV